MFRALLGFALLLPSPLLAQAITPALGWAHETSDIRPDRAVRYGRLPNGMRYAILANKTPPGEASLRLAFDTGSLDEADAERGLAHFLEHMVLNGTRNVPEGEFVRRLERLGLRFGPDTNASTGWDQTVYKLDLPKPEVMSEALFLLREVAGEALLDQASVDAERNVIQAERRQRDVPSFRASVAQMRHGMAGLTLPDRLPIGTPETVSTISAAQLRNFYDRFYRPENAVLVAVGDFDPAKIRRRSPSAFPIGEGVAHPA